VPAPAVSRHTKCPINHKVPIATGLGSRPDQDGSWQGNCIPNGMLHWSLIFLIIAIIAGLLGFTGIAGAAVGIAKILFFVFLVIWLIVLLSVRKIV
jgi:uncharacterized membrane protein YtjA (UPF0391 family)